VKKKKKGDMLKKTLFFKVSKPGLKVSGARRKGNMAEKRNVGRGRERTQQKDEESKVKRALQTALGVGETGDMCKAGKRGKKRYQEGQVVKFSSERKGDMVTSDRFITTFYRGEGLHCSSQD